MSRPFGVHAIGDIYQRGVTCQPEGSRRWFYAVGRPYTAGRLRAAWWVLTGRAYAFQWPKPGDLEAALDQPPSRPKFDPFSGGTRNAWVP